MLSKQSIRKEHTIYLNDVLMTKEEIIEISKDFNEKEEKHFRKMLQQGGSLKIKGNKFKINNDDTCMVKDNCNEKVLLTNMKTCTQQNYCFASGYEECIFIMTR